jgi:hypothetical protein
MDQANWKSPLRDLARQLRDVAKSHESYSQVVELMIVVDGYINAIALIEEQNRQHDGQARL